MSVLKQRNRRIASNKKSKSFALRSAKIAFPMPTPWENFLRSCVLGIFQKKQCLQIMQNGEIEKVFDYRVQKGFSRRLPPERIFSFPQKYRPPKTIQIPRSLHAKSAVCPDRKEVNRAAQPSHSLFPAALWCSPSGCCERNCE